MRCTDTPAKLALARWGRGIRMIHTVYLSQTISFYLNPSLSLSIFVALSWRELHVCVWVWVWVCVCECEAEFVCECVSLWVCSLCVSVTDSDCDCYFYCDCVHVSVSVCVYRVGGKGLAVRETWIIGVLGRTIVCFYGHPIGKSPFSETCRFLTRLRRRSRR